MANKTKSAFSHASSGAKANNRSPQKTQDKVDEVVHIMHDSLVKVPKPDKDLPEVEDQPDELQAEDLLVEPSAEKQKLADWWKNIKVPEKLKNMKSLDQWDNMKFGFYKAAGMGSEENEETNTMNG
ncbi:uncharacterized protein isoform X2 [Takifugu rubripes]|uniref:uncharacterized protein isoform X2 n=1 Tax=Takifugu rubripes TaxID=31033 RepID=UPI0011455AC7|nr:uncharacterized protein LOC115246504 isoform X2 [Takifugu rubripes]